LLPTFIEKYPDLDTEAIKMLTFIHASCRSLKVYTTDEIIYFLTNSKRIREDLILGVMRDDFNFKIIFREWCDYLEFENECRVFVWNKEITCITQYYSLVYVPYLNQNKSVVAKRIVEYFNDKVKDLIPISNYTIDICVMEKEIIVIEINPPPPMAGTSLFNWDINEDKEIILNGPFEFRTLDNVPDNVLDNIQKDMREHLDSLLPKRRCIIQ